MFVIDTNDNVTGHLGNLRSRGVVAIGRYYSSRAWKRITKQEAVSVSNAGMKIFVVFENDGEPSELVWTVERAAGQILDPEGVERHSVRHRHDLGIDDIGAADRKRTGDPREQAGVIGGVEGNLGYRAVQIDALFNDKGRTARFRLAHQSGVSGMGLGVEG